ncbi:MAG TPA: hypothetical protein VMV23_06530, partial [Candidatus Nanopelagicaceae bacterium]|nr:hypothetical protein [Candidatus Nanopelagicaceae bacterium]
WWLGAQPAEIIPGTSADQDFKLGLSAAAPGPRRVRRLETLTRVEGVKQLSVDSDGAHAGAAPPSATRASGC